MSKDAAESAFQKARSLEEAGDLAGAAAAHCLRSGVALKLTMAGRMLASSSQMRYGNLARRRKQRENGLRFRKWRHPNPGYENPIKLAKERLAGRRPT